jgi:hypothetical protein
MFTVAGCGAVAEPQPTETTEPAPTETMEPTPTETTESGAASDAKSRAVLGDAVIVYERSGGIAGETNTWKIYADGRVVDGEGNEWQVAPAQVEELLADLETMGFFELDESYMPLDTCCDRFTYTLVVGTDGGAHRVTTIDDSDAPEAVWNALDSVSTFIQDAQTAAE